MEMNDALDALTALAHETRLSVFRVLVAVGKDGLPAGVIAERLSVRPNTLSAHLAQLTRAGLVKPVREGRTIRYSAHYGGMRDVIAFLMQDCCGGQPEICAPLNGLLADAARCADGKSPC